MTLIRAVLEAIDRGDLGVRERHSGYAASGSAMAALRAAFSDRTTTVAHQIADGEYVCTHSSIEAIHTGPLFGLPPTGRRVHYRNVSLDRIVGDEVIEHHSESGLLSVLRQLGVEFTLPTSRP